MIGLVLITLQRQQHPLPPWRVEPVIQPDVVADKDPVDADAVVALLQEEAQLHVLEVCLEANVVVGGVGHLVAAHALAQHVALVAGSAARAVLVGAGRTSGAVPHSAGDDSLAGGVLIGAGAAPGLLDVRANVIVLAAVHNWEDIVQPVAERPVRKDKSVQESCVIVEKQIFSSKET